LPAIVTHWERTAKPITRPLKVEELCKAFVLYRQKQRTRQGNTLRGPLHLKTSAKTSGRLHVLSRRLSISVTTNFQEKVSGFLSGSVEPEEVQVPSARFSNETDFCSFAILMALPV